MKPNLNNQDLESSEVKDTKLTEVLHANKNLYDKLNKIPEIEAIQSIEVEEEVSEYNQESSSWFNTIIPKIKTS